MILTEYNGIIWMWFYDENMNLMWWNSFRERDSKAPHKTLEEVREDIKLTENNLLYDSGEL